MPVYFGITTPDAIAMPVSCGDDWRWRNLGRLRRFSLGSRSGGGARSNPALATEVYFTLGTIPFQACREFHGIVGLFSCLCSFHSIVLGLCILSFSIGSAALHLLPSV